MQVPKEYAKMGLYRQKRVGKKGKDSRWAECGKCKSALPAQSPWHYIVVLAGVICTSFRCPSACEVIRLAFYIWNNLTSASQMKSEMSFSATAKAILKCVDPLKYFSIENKSNSVEKGLHLNAPFYSSTLQMSLGQKYTCLYG